MGVVYLVHLQFVFCLLGCGHAGGCGWLAIYMQHADYWVGVVYLVTEHVVHFR